MKYDRVLKFIGMGIALLLLFGLSSATLAENEEDYSLQWWSVDGGGTTHSAVNEYTLSGTIGQFDAGDLYGGRYSLSGGFWGNLVAREHIYLPLAIRD